MIFAQPRQVGVGTISPSATAAAAPLSVIISAIFGHDARRKPAQQMSR